MRAVTADRYQGVQVFVYGGQYSFSSARWVIEVVARGAEQRPALGNDPLEVFGEQRCPGEFGREPGPSVGDTDDLMTVAKCHLTDRANSRVQPGRVTSRGKNPDTQCNSS